MMVTHSVFLSRFSLIGLGIRKLPRLVVVCISRIIVTQSTARAGRQTWTHK